MTYQPQKISGEPLSAHRLFCTRDIDEARQVVAGKFCDHKLLPRAAHDRFESCHNRVPGRMLSLNFLRYGSTVEIDPGELTDFYLVQIPLRGRADIRNGGRDVLASPRRASILNPTRATRMTWHEGCEKLLVQIDRTALHELAEAMTGHALIRPVVFDPEIRLDTPGMRRWAEKVFACVTAAQNGAAFGASGYRFQNAIEEDLVARLLRHQPSAISHLLEDGPACPARHVRLARAYIHENLSEPVTLRDIAREAGCSVRSLQTGFKDMFGCSPMRYLQRQRLQYAHYLLQTMPPGTQVSAIAYDAGFTHMGRFSIAYREAFGQTPSETLSHGAAA